MTDQNETSDNSSTWRCPIEVIHAYPCTQLKDVKNCLLGNSTFTCVVLFICTLGLMGNGIVFWLLGFRIKRNFFSVYVLNLAAADFGVLTAVWSLYICAWSSTNPNPHTPQSDAYDYLIYLFFFVQCSSIHFLTAISADRCLVIFFPVWHRCHRPKNLSAIVSSVLWGISCIFLGMIFFASCWKGTNTTIVIFFVMFVSVMVISTVILFFKVCCNTRLRRHGRVHVAILLSLFFFIVMTIPISLFVKHHSHIDGISSITLLFTCMNSSINPFIYFLFGRCWSFDQSRSSIRDALWWFFKEEEGSGNESQSSNLNPSLKKKEKKKSLDSYSAALHSESQSGLQSPRSPLPTTDTL